MRRSSVVGPLLLIGIGTLFLLRNVLPELPLLDYLARFWPFLLIVWGGLRLLEIMVWAGRGKPLPARGMSGGEWLMVIFLCMLGISLHAVRGFTTWLPQSGLTMGGLDVFGESYDYPLSGEKAAGKTPRVVIATFRGNARITGADVDSVKVTGRTTVRSLDRSGADRANQEAVFEITGDNNALTIRTNQDRVSAGQRISAELEITVPKGASIEAHGRRGDFDVNGVAGAVTIESDNAAVRLDSIGGPVRVDVRGGDIVRASNLKSGIDLRGRGSDVDFENIEGEVIIDGSFFGVTQLRSLAKRARYTTPYSEFSIAGLPGNVRLTPGDLNATNLIGPVKLTSSRSWDAQISDFTNSLEIALDGGDLQLRPGSAVKMNVRTRRGNIELALPANAHFDLVATSLRGEVTNDYGAPLTEESSRRGGTLRASTGGPSINLQTERGRLVVRKAAPGEGPLAPKGKSLNNPLPPEAPAPGDLPERPKLPRLPPTPPRPINQ
jgi:DUF4097 and DUF4098 domain-containing protein YvlB